jgi:hypothetical protein
MQKDGEKKRRREREREAERETRGCHGWIAREVEGLGMDEADAGAAYMRADACRSHCER